MRDAVYFLRPKRGVGWTVVRVVEHGRYHDRRPKTWCGPYSSELDATSAMDSLEDRRKLVRVEEEAS